MAISASNNGAAEAAKRTHSTDTNRDRPIANSKKKKGLMFSPLRLSLAALLAISCLFASLPASAQSNDAKPADKPAQAQPDADAQKRAEEFADAARQVSGPAGNAECVFLGRNVVGLLYRNDMDTAFRHLDLYDRFGCPGPHIQSAFRCVLRQTASIDPKQPRTLTEKVHSCWVNPIATTTAAAAAAPAPAAAPSAAAAQPAPAAPAKSEPAPAAPAPQGATPPPANNQPAPPKTSGTPSR
jgi:hypothetical protein